MLVRSQESGGKAGVSSRRDEWVEEELTLLALCSGKGVVGTFTYIWATPPPPSSSHYSQPQGWTASLVFPWQQSLNLVHFAAAVQALPVVTHQVHITKSFHDGCFYSHFSCVPTEVLVCGEHTHLNNLSDRSGWDLRLTVWIEAGLPPRWAPRGLDLVPQWRSHNFTSSFFIWCYFAVT